MFSMNCMYVSRLWLNGVGTNCICIVSVKYLAFFLYKTQACNCIALIERRHPAGSIVLPSAHGPLKKVDPMDLLLC